MAIKINYILFSVKNINSLLPWKHYFLGKYLNKKKKITLLGKNKAENNKLEKKKKQFLKIPIIRE